MVNPRVLLLDEPLSALDFGFREEVRNSLKRLHQSSSATFLMVTHDFAEVLSLAGRAAVINNGRIEQVGDVTEIFERPSSTFVADFIGMKNLFKTSFSGTHTIVSSLAWKREARSTSPSRPLPFIYFNQRQELEVRSGQILPLWLTFFYEGLLALYAILAKGHYANQIFRIPYRLGVFHI
jgi:ABC-type Fe3+/spermidine/putrescine transport system ATPase subunit